MARSTVGKAAAAFSTLLQKAFTPFDESSDERSEIEGKTHHSAQFNVWPGADRFVLNYPLNDLRVDELSLTHNSSKVYLSIRPICHEYLIPSIGDLNGNSEFELDSSIVKKYGHLRWEDVTSEEAMAYFMSTCPRQDGMWSYRAKSLLGLAVDIARAKSQQSSNPVAWRNVRSLLGMDKLLAEHTSGALPEHVAHMLRQYLINLPGYSDEDAQNGSLLPKVYEQHGYLSMVLLHLFPDMASSAPSRGYRPLDASIEFESPTPIESVKARVESGLLIVDVKLIDGELKRVPIAH